MIADLPMYQRPELVDAHNNYWSLIHQQMAERGLDSPNQLSAQPDIAQSWVSPHLVLSQTCGMPYRNSLHGKTQIVGTPDFQLEGCSPGYYRSAIVVRQQDAENDLVDFEHTTFAFNSEQSQSGYSAAYWHFKSHGFWFSNRVQSHSHTMSAQAVAEGSADIASIDAVTWRLMSSYEMFTKQLSVLAWTEPTPGLPYITASANDRQQIFDSIASAIDKLSATDKSLLGIQSLVHIPAEDYLSVPNPNE